jgi:hypothetical protein
MRLLARSGFRVGNTARNNLAAVLDDFPIPATVFADPPPLKWSDLRYVFDIKEDCNGKEAIQADPVQKSAAVRLASIQRLGFVEERSDNFSRLFACQNGNDFKRCSRSAPLQDPFLEQSKIIAFHQLKAAAAVRLNPAINILQSVGNHSAFITEMSLSLNRSIIMNNIVCSGAFRQMKPIPTWLPASAVFGMPARTAIGTKLPISTLRHHGRY